MNTPRRLAFASVTALVIVVIVPAPAHAQPRQSETPQVEDSARDPWRTADPLIRTMNRGIALMERYEYAAAVQVFEEAARLAPESTETRVNLAVALFNRHAKGDLEHVERLLDEAVAGDSNHVRALYFRAIVHQFRGQDEQARPLIERVVELAPHDAYAWYFLARTKSHQGQPSRTDLERAVKENPALLSAYYDLMLLTRREGDLEAADRYKEIFQRLRASPLSERVVIPHYNQMGPLASVQPLARPPFAPLTTGELAAGRPRTLYKASPSRPLVGGDAPAQRTLHRDSLPGFDAQICMADVNQDGHSDLLTIATSDNGNRTLTLLLGKDDGTLADATAASGLTQVKAARSCAFGDFDNDGKVDVFIGCAGPNHLLRGRGDGTFEDVTGSTKTGGPDMLTSSAVFLDADHDSDLDIYVCNMAGRSEGTAAANQLLNNNGDGTFTDIAATGGVACADRSSVMLAPVDLDGDRDTDLIVFHADAPVQTFFNDRGGRYHEGKVTVEPIDGPHGGVAQDFNGDGRPDVLVSSGPKHAGRLFLSNGSGSLQPSAQFDECVKTPATWGRVDATRVADVDLDGDLDIIAIGQAGHLLLNDGWGRFTVRPNVWPLPPDGRVLAAEVADLHANGLTDVLCVTAIGNGRIDLIPTALSPPANWVAFAPTGERGVDKRTRSPVSGYGTRMELRSGVHRQTLTYTGLSGGRGQSHLPIVFGLTGVSRADYLHLTWPDGVTQCEVELAVNTTHQIRETERRVSSCPVLFAWNGRKFEFVGDFSGVGGLGYFVAPGEYTTPQVEDHVKIEPEQLAARDGVYEVRVVEPMEEVAYVDKLTLLAVDHPGHYRIFPDERLAITGPPPSHRVLTLDEPIYAVTAVGPRGRIEAERLTHSDRVYAYHPRLDPRFPGFCEPHSLTLDFGDRLAPLTASTGVYLFIRASIEYPYSQTTYAAAQAGIVWRPLKIERQTEQGRWETIVPDAGAPGGMGRMIAVDLTGKLRETACSLRVSTNLEIYVDQAFVALDRGTEDLTITRLPLASAHLRRLGFPAEYSPDGEPPTIYSYDSIQPTSSFKTLEGRYTRYGRVEPLLESFDDRYVIMATGDEIAVRFDARALPMLPPRTTRSFILVSHAYCKDMDLYTATPDTVTPLPFRAMSKYPYEENEHSPGGETYRRYHDEFNTRQVD